MSYVVKSDDGEYLENHGPSWAHWNGLQSKAARFTRAEAYRLALRWHICEPKVVRLTRRSSLPSAVAEPKEKP